MLTDFSKAILQHFSADENGLSVVQVSRAALGLIAVLRSWKQELSACVVAMPAAVCHDVVAAVLEAGYQPFFCDIDPDNGLVPEGEWLRAREAGAMVAIVVHLYGNAADVETVRNIFPSPDCLLIDDAAQALGTKYKGHQVGLKGDAGLISFGATKHISAGGAAVLTRDVELLKRVQLEIEFAKYPEQSLRLKAEKEFRKQFECARENLRENGDNSGFVDLLKGYGVALYPPFPTTKIAEVEQALKVYSETASKRQYKADLWHEPLQESGLLAVGMGHDVVPWRYACRLPGINWREQHVLGEAMRERGLNVSHWYLPANWFLQKTASDSMPGAETLAREVFQFWIDEETTVADIKEGAQVVCGLISEFLNTREK